MDINLIRHRRQTTFSFRFKEKLTQSWQKEGKIASLTGMVSRLTDFKMVTSLVFRVLSSPGSLCNMASRE
jgi:hypothetical protein